MTVGVYIGDALASNLSNSPDLDTFDMDHVEVLDGSIASASATI
jgi:hypothetical protein